MVYFTTFGDTKLAFPLGHFFVYKVPYLPNILNPDTTTAQLFISRLFISLPQTRTDSPPGASHGAAVYCTVEHGARIEALPARRRRTA